MKLGGGIGVMLIGFFLCYVAVKDTFNKGANKYIESSTDPFAIFQSARVNFQNATGGNPDAGAVTTSGGNLAA